MKKSLLVLLMVLLTIGLLAGCGGGADTTSGDTDTQSGDTGDAAVEKMKVAFIYNAVIGDYGWAYGHEKAREETQAALDFVETSCLENVTPGANAERVMNDLATEGYDVIIAVSGDYEADVRKVAPNFPDTDFLLCCGAYSADNVESFYPKATQIWWVLGKVAAQLTKTNTIGMVGAVTAPMDIQIQNAFLLGAQSINPDVVERIIYINTYYDPAAERDAALSLIDAGVDVITQATNTPAHVQAAVEKGVYAMSQFEDMSQFGPDNYVSGDKFVWSAYYIPTLQAIQDGTWVPCPTLYEPDMSSGVCDLIEFGPMVTDEMKAVAEEAVEQIKADPMVMWKGPIYDNQGNLVIGEGEYLTPEQLLAMNWWVKGTITSGGQ